MTRSHTLAEARSDGFTLVELMVALLLGLVVVGATMSTMLANRQTYRSSDAMSQIQEGLRTAFELMSRDLREAGATLCGNSKVANVLNNAGSTSAAWWETWEGEELRGYADTESTAAVAFGTAAGTRVSGTDAVKIMRAKDIGVTVVEHKTTASPPNFELSQASSEISAGRILMACDSEQASIFQATSYDSTTKTVAHAASGSPGNCSIGLGYPTNCTTAKGYTYPANSSIGKLSAVVWFVGNNGRTEDGGRSLYRASLNGTATQIEEMVPGITDLQLGYRRTGQSGFDLDPSDPTYKWSNVNAVNVTLTIQSLAKGVSTESTNDGRLSPAGNLSYVVVLMNRVQ